MKLNMSEPSGKFSVGKDINRDNLYSKRLY
jgi:hypothetical protein